MISPLTFTMAVWSKVLAGQGDRRAPVEVIRRAVPHRISHELYLPPAFYRAARAVADSSARAREVISR